MNKKIKIIFMGTPDFALPSLQALIEDKDFEVLAVVTQEDKKIGRKQEIIAPPVKQLAQKYGLPVFQPQKIKGNKEFIEIIKNLKPDMNVVVAYGQILPQKILEIPSYGSVNLHASLLPNYRGASPIEASILHGDTETGITIMKMEERLDAGPVLNITRLTIQPNDTNETLTAKLALLGGGNLPYVLKDYAEGGITPIPQNESKATFCHKIEKNDGLVDVKNFTAQEILNRIRAYTPWPSVFLLINKKRLKLIEIELDQASQLEPGAIQELTKNSIVMGTKQGAIIPKKVQLEGKKTMTIQEFLLGNRSLLIK